MINLSDTTVRLYRKKDGSVSLKLRGYLMVDTDKNFSLVAYLKDISCSLTLANGKIIKFSETSVSNSLECKHELNTLVHSFSASGRTQMKKLENSVGKLRLNYWLNFTGHQTEEPSFIEYVVPVIRKRTAYEH